METEFLYDMYDVDNANHNLTWAVHVCHSLGIIWHKFPKNGNNMLTL